METDDMIFNEALAAIDQAALKAYLLELSRPCYESRLLKLAFPGFDIQKASALALFQRHFLLFHLLYRWQDEFYNQNRYLHVHFMRIGLMDYPPEGCCRFFEESLYEFCNARCDSGQSYCPRHLEKLGGHLLDTRSIKYFYLAPRNYTCLDEATAEAMLNGTWELLANYDAYRQSLQKLDLPESADMPMIRRKYRILAKQYHPDAGGGNEQFHEINTAYQLLLRLHALIPDPVSNAD